MQSALDIVILGLSITSSWGNGHATTYRGLAKALAARGHRLTFLERDVPWYRKHRDLPQPGYAATHLYGDLDELRQQHGRQLRAADLVIVGSYVPDGIAVGNWVTATARGLTAFYDIDTPVTLAQLEQGECTYLSRELIGKYDLYLSFTGGPTLAMLERKFCSPAARALYCSADPDEYRPSGSAARRPRHDLGYMGTYSRDRQPTLRQLLLKPAATWPQGRFIVAGPQYPASISWPENVQRIDHLPPHRHRAFYNAQRFTLNVTRAEMLRRGHSPSVRLFEAAACGTPIISDWWAGLDELFLPGKEILIARSARECLRWLRELPEDERRVIGQRGRERVLNRHTAWHRAIELESHVAGVRRSKHRRAARIRA